MTKEELSKMSMREINQLLDAAIAQSHINFLKQLADRRKGKLSWRTGVLRRN